MKEEYIIINKSVLEKRIKELIKIDGVITSHLVRELEQILSQSTPLIPEIEKAFDEGQSRMQYQIIEKLGLKYQTEQVSQSTILNMEVHSEDYISNLKLNI